MLGPTEYCDSNGVAPLSQCTFHKVAGAYEIEIEDFNSCGISSQYNAADDYVSMNLVLKYLSIKAN